MALYSVTRAKNYPFLSAVPMLEGRAPGETIELTGDEFEDYEDVVRRFAAWQKRLAETDPM